MGDGDARAALGRVLWQLAAHLVPREVEARDRRGPLIRVVEAALDFGRGDEGAPHGESRARRDARRVQVRADGDGHAVAEVVLQRVRPRREVLIIALLGAPEPASNSQVSIRRVRSLELQVRFQCISDSDFVESSNALERASL